MKYSARRWVAEHGYLSTLAAFRANRARYTRLLARHGIALGDPAALDGPPRPWPYRSAFARSLASSLEFLDSRLRPARG
jgi:hypothetical protein